MILILTIVALLVLAYFGAPLFSLILAVAMLGFYYQDISLMVIPIELYRITNTPLLLALPLFTFAGYLLSESNTSQRLVRVSRAMLGWFPTELSVVTVVVCAFFTAFTGATGITIVALGALLYPALTQSGYPKDYSLGLVTTSGSMGLLLPPSLPLILYVIIVQQMNLGQSITIEQVFLAGILPTLLMFIMLFAWGLWVTRAKPIALIPFNFAELRHSLREAIWEIPLPFFVLGGIYSGIFAISEAAAVTALYVLVVEVFIYKEIGLKKLVKVIQDSMTMVGGILLILGVALALTNYLIDAEVPTKLFEWIKQHIDSKFTFLILLNLFLLVLGMILDIFSAIVIMVPLIVPVAMGYGIHPVHLGIIFLANMQLGYLTPPVGMNLFIASYRFKKPITEIYRSTIPLMLLLLVSVLIITYWPSLSLVFISN
ncbi:MAG: TRAP transporter large permease subunit [Gammaproteobacteria bacterium]|nr:TRAP transporter large permease subunit [Gammaproteobacteria bacterium]